MARQVREWDPKHRRPTSGADANQAISDWTAQHATAQRGRKLKREYKQAERKVTNISQQAVGHSKAANRFSTSLAGTSSSITRSGQKLKGLEQRYNQAATRLSKDMTANIGNYLKPGQQTAYASGNEKQRAKIVANAYDKHVKRLLEYKTYQSAQKSLSASHNAYTSQVQRGNALNARVTRANKRTQMAQRAYMRAYRAYKNSRYVPYSPA